MRWGISSPNVGDPIKLVDLAVTAETAGWDGFFLWDHLHLRRDMHLDVHDPWVLLGACATRTTTVRLGTLVTPVARRRPHVLAKQITTLDHLSRGRAVLGVGLGVPAEDEYGAFGEPIDPRVHASMLDDGLAALDGLWRGEPFSHSGPHYTVNRAHLLPRPLQEPRPPVWVAALWPNPRPLRRAARWDGVVPLSGNGEPLTPEIVANVVERVAELRGDLIGFDVVATLAPDIDPAEYEAAGATWAIESIWPWPETWYDDLLARCGQGPLGVTEEKA
jgi:alkanesulfonate monooxygenase SsuD/methylene tetrahydromethanopterin reductase-like flavin-dependent oxidoreductase (luciferase family)